jgi:FkbM family methyltransferase
MNQFIRVIRKAVRAKGFDMIHYAPWENLFAHCGIDMIIDVGANLGQSWESFRWAGFKGPIISFEPNPEIFRQIEKIKDDNWQRRPYALSSHSGEAKFHLTNLHVANSLLKPLGHIKVTGEITVPLYRLDELWTKEGFTGKRAFLKIDTEGHDLEVVKGASGVLDRIQVIMLEIAALPRFEGEPPLPAVVNFMSDLGFHVCRAEKNSQSPAAGMDTALDMVFARKELIQNAPP